MEEENMILWFENAIIIILYRRMAVIAGFYGQIFLQAP